MWGVSWPVLVLYMCQETCWSFWGWLVQWVEPECEEWEMKIHTEKPFIYPPQWKGVPAGDFCFISLSLFISLLVFFFKSKPQKNPNLFHHQRQRNHWTELCKKCWKTTEVAVPGHGQLLSLLGWLLSPSFIPWADPPESRKQPKLHSFFNSFNHNQLFLSGGILLDGKNCNLPVFL